MKNDQNPDGNLNYHSLNIMTNGFNSHLETLLQENMVVVFIKIKYTASNDEYNYQDFLPALLIDGIGHCGTQPCS